MKRPVKKTETHAASDSRAQAPRRPPRRRKAQESAAPPVASTPRFKPPRQVRDTEHTAAAATIKLQKRLADAGLGSRRAMETLIEGGEVLVNDKRARIGMRVSAADRIVVRGQPVSVRSARLSSKLPRIVLYHKPEGEIVSRHDPEGRVSVFDRAGFLRRGRWLAIGRLDFNTCGLLVFTDSGELADRLSHPRFAARRDYAVRVLGTLSTEQMRMLTTGVALEDGAARFEVLESQGGEGSNRWYRVRVREGRNRLVRRLFAAAGLMVSRLMRTAFGPFELPPRIKRGQWLRLEDAEVRRAMAELMPGQAERHPPKPAPSGRQRHPQSAQSHRGAAGTRRHRPR
jgi:23S rRNA pseudouridine2605 synthase